MIHFFLDARSGTSPYLQIVEQVKRALLLQNLHVGDQLPTIKEVVATVAINPNTVLKAYRQLENEGLIQSRPGVGTFVVRTLAGPETSRIPELRASLVEWLAGARAAGLDEDSIEAVFDEARRATLAEARA